LNRKFTSVDQLPENPLDMPPPFWRSSGAIFHITSSLEELCVCLRELSEVHPRIECLLSEYFEKNPEPPEDDSKFAEISEPLWDIESKIKLKCELAVFMAAIEAEELINQVSVYNLNKDIAESIEKLSPPEKLLVLSSILTKKSIKGTRSYEAIKNLMSWRNSYAHGHCTDRPIKTLRHNHLIEPEEYPSVPKEIEEMCKHLEEYLELSRYLRSIGRNKYTKGTSVHDVEIEEHLKQIQRYKLTYGDDSQIYDIEYD
jgi:hypothetical protein